ncbi:MAG: septum formation initiator family protein, partial [Paracoccaceae bacterium]
MRLSRFRPAMGAAITGVLFLGVASYFAFAAVQGNFGVVKRVQVTADKAALTEERDRLRAEVTRMQNLTLR